MDVCLGQYGQCNFISAKHAFIFYDEVSSVSVQIFMMYRKNSKIWDTSNNCHTCPKNRKV